MKQDEVRFYYDQPPRRKKCSDLLELRFLCLLIGILIFVEEAIQIGQKINICRSAVLLEEDEADWLLYRDLPIILALRIPALIAAAFLINGVRKKYSTYIAVFLWVTLEVCLLFLIYIVYKNMRSLPQENLDIIAPISAGKVMCWWLVNNYHNKLKFEEVRAKMKPIRLETAV